MALTDILSTQTLICLGIMLLLVGCVALYFMQKMNEQNHKIASMLGLVSTMAEELNFVRSRMQILSSGISSGQNGGLSELKNSNPQDSAEDLINVSDDDEDDDEDDDSDSEEGDSEEGDSEEGNSGSESESDSEEEDGNNNQNIKTINMGETLDMNIQCEALAEEEDNENGESSSNSNSELEDELDSLNEENLDALDNDDELTANDGVTLTNADFIKSIDISSLEESQNDKETFDYKKMSLNKLRSIVVKKGLVKDSSKLKKNELLKLLNSE